jgi:hypothetical protein
VNRVAAFHWCAHCRLASDLLPAGGSLFAALLDEFVKLQGLIEDVNFDSRNMEQDIIVWTRTTAGEYSAKSAYQMQFEGGIFSSFPKIVWKVWAPSKCKFFMWLLLQNRV